MLTIMIFFMNLRSSFSSSSLVPIRGPRHEKKINIEVHEPREKTRKSCFSISSSTHHSPVDIPCFCFVLSRRCLDAFVSGPRYAACFTSMTSSGERTTFFFPSAVRTPTNALLCSFNFSYVGDISSSCLNTTTLFQQKHRTDILKITHKYLGWAIKIKIFKQKSLVKCRKWQNRAHNCPRSAQVSKFKWEAEAKAR